MEEQLLRKLLVGERKLHRCYLVGEVVDGGLEVRKENLRPYPVGGDVLGRSMLRDPPYFDRQSSETPSVI